MSFEAEQQPMSVIEPGKELAMNLIKHWPVVAVLLVVTACVNAPDEEAELLDDQAPGGTSSELLQQWNIATGNAQLDKDSGEVSITADCAFIEWCNRPSSISPDLGTVCRVRTGCPFPPTAAVVNECTNDALAVCGRILQPAFICRQGASCP